MSFPRYESYKDSGIEWLGEVPEHWEVWKLSHAFNQIGSGTTPKSDILAYYENGEIAWINTGDLNDGRLLDCNKRITELALSDHSALKMFPEGSLVIAMYGATIGKLALLSFSATVNQACCVFSGYSEIQSGFLFYWFLGMRQHIVSMATGGGQPNISQEILRNIRVPRPHQEEQQTISAFLDRETAKIDELVSEQKNLIKLLKEKRQAVISHSVTKGLNPAASMKNSGIEWLGKVPEHWGICALKRMTKKVTDGAHISPETENGIYEFVSTKDVRDDGIDFENCLRTSEASYEYLVRTGCKPSPGDVLFSKDGTIGRTVVVRENRDFVVASSLIIIKPDSEAITPDFLNYLCQSSVVVGQVESFVKGAGLPRLSIQNLLKIVGVFPPLTEQRLIVDYLNLVLGQMASLLTSALETITLLQERRTALISAAVTGKIDVRGLVSDKPEVEQAA